MGDFQRNNAKRIRGWEDKFRLKEQEEICSYVNSKTPETKIEFQKEDRGVSTMPCFCLKIQKGSIFSQMWSLGIASFGFTFINSSLLVTVGSMQWL